MDRFAEQRKEMVRHQLESRGIGDTRVLDAMRKVPRHLFVQPEDLECAYRDGPLPIGFGQTISQPYIVALMCEAMNLTGDMKVLDIGTGSGYAAAVLAELAQRVISIERLPELADFARQNLQAAGYDTVTVHCADGCLGYPAEAPYDAIAVAAGAPVPPQALKSQLKTGGRLVIPVGENQRYQDLLKITRLSKDDYRTDNLGGVAFVPLVGEGGWTKSPDGRS